MKTEFSQKEQDDFIEKCDPEITEDVVTSFDINPDDLDWDIFYILYQRRHIEKYGKELTL